MKKSLLIASTGLLPIALVSVPVQAAEQATSPAKVADFNGDGRQDLVIGHPYLTVGGRKNAGGIVVFPGAQRLADQGRTITRDTTGVVGGAQANEYFGRTLASGDFDRDGFADLAVSATGKVVVLYGSRSGLTGTRSYVISPGFAAVLRGPGSTRGSLDGIRFGAVMSAGDYNGDRYVDLAVRSDRGTGGILVLRGGQAGLTTSGAVRLTNGLKRFGTKLASADVTGDGITDLMTSQETTTGTAKPSGATEWDQPFALVPGSGSGLIVTRSWRWTVRATAFFGFTVGDLNGDRKADFVRNNHAPADPPTQGSMMYRLSSGTGFGPARTVVLGTETHASGRFAIGDVTGDGRGDLAATMTAAIYSWVRLLAGSSAGVGPTAGNYGGETEANSYGEQIFIGNVSGDARADVVFTIRSGYGGGTVMVHSAGRDTGRDVLSTPTPDGLGFTLLSP